MPVRYNSNAMEAQLCAVKVIFDYHLNHHKTDSGMIHEPVSCYALPM
jgi:hypothetical protein